MSNFNKYIYGWDKEFPFYSPDTIEFKVFSVSNIGFFTNTFRISGYVEDANGKRKYLEFNFERCIFENIYIQMKEHDSVIFKITYDEDNSLDVTISNDKTFDLSFWCKRIHLQGHKDELEYSYDFNYTHLVEPWEEVKKSVLFESLKCEFSEEEFAFINKETISFIIPFDINIIENAYQKVLNNKISLPYFRDFLNFYSMSINNNDIAFKIQTLRLSIAYSENVKDIIPFVERFIKENK